MSDINGKSRPAEENDFCRIEITIDRTTGKRTINISTEEDITDFDIEDTEGWSFEQLDAKYDELQAALEELEDDPPTRKPLMPGTKGATGSVTLWTSSKIRWMKCKLTAKDRHPWIVGAGLYYPVKQFSPLFCAV